MVRRLLLVAVLTLLTTPAPARSAESKRPLPSDDDMAKMAKAMPQQARVKPAKPRKLLVFGQCHGFYHKSIPFGAKALQIMGRTTGAFEVVLSDDVAVFDPDRLEQFDGVCMNNTTLRHFLPSNFKELPAADKKAAQDREALRKKTLLEFVRSGRGLVGIHAATDCLYDWAEYGEMMGGYFSGHPWHEAVGVKIDDPGHPLCRAFKGRGFTITDEIYQFRDPYSRDRLRLLLSLDTAKTNMDKGKKIRRKDGDFAVSWTRSYGKGRVFYCSLGHRNEIFWNPMVLQFYLDGIQYALGDLPADSTPSAKLSKDYIEKSQRAVEQTALDDAFAEIATYTLGGNTSGLKLVAELVLKSHGSPRERGELLKRFAALLASDATVEGKRFVCRQLHLMGTDEAVPQLAALLTDPELGDMARYGLERMETPAAGAALLAALPKAEARLKVGIVNSLGARGQADAVPSLAKLLRDANPDLVRAAAAALGKVGNPAAVAALNAAAAQTQPELAGAFDDALLACADAMAKTDTHGTAALAIYTGLYQAAKPSRLRVGALEGLAKVQREAALPLVLEALRGDDPEVALAAVSLARDVPGRPATEAFARVLPSLPATAQERLLYALGDRRDPAARPAVVKALDHKDEPVRVAALQALATVGDASVVERLVQIAAAAKPRSAEQKAAQRTVDRLPGSAIDTTLVALLGQQDAKVRMEAVARLQARRAACGVPRLLAVAEKDADPKVRVDAAKALAVLAGEADLPKLVALLRTKTKGAEQTEAEKAAATVARKIADEAKRCDAVLAGLGKADDPRLRCSLIRVLGRIGSPQGLDALHAALKHPSQDVQDAAIRALAGWPTPRPLDTLMAIAGESPNLVHQVLALRGCARLLALPNDRHPSESLKLYEKTMALAKRDDERKLLLAGLGSVAHPSALGLAESYMGNKALQDEAAMAAAQIYHAIRRPKALTASRRSDECWRAMDGNPATRWSTGEPQKKGQWFLIDLGWPREVSRITMDAGKSRSDYPKGYEVYVANTIEDMGEPVAKGLGKTTVVDLKFEPKIGRYIKLGQTRTQGGWFWSMHDLRINGQRNAAGAFDVADRAKWKVTASVANEDAGNCIDGDMKARWGTRGPQKQGQWLMVDLGEVRKVHRVVLDAGRSRNDYPRAYRVLVSKDGKDWGPPVAGGGTKSAVTDISLYPKEGRYVKIVQTASTDRNWWSVYDLQVFTEPGGSVDGQ